MKVWTRLLCASLLALTACESQVSKFRDGSRQVEDAADTDLSAPPGRVTDAAGILGAKAEERLTQRLRTLEDDLGHQLVVVTVPTLNGQAIEDYTRELAKRWGVGRRDHNDGLVVLVAPNERRVRIEVGTGLEQVVTNDFASTVIQDHMLPLFGEGDYEGGISAGVAALTGRLNAHAQRPAG